MSEVPQSTQRLIRLPEVKLRTGLGRSSIYRKMADGSFPQPRKVGERAVAWHLSDIDDWIDNLPLRPAGQPLLPRQ